MIYFCVLIIQFYCYFYNDIKVLTTRLNVFLYYILPSHILYLFCNYLIVVPNLISNSKKKYSLYSSIWVIGYIIIGYIVIPMKPTIPPIKAAYLQPFKIVIFPIQITRNKSTTNQNNPPNRLDQN